MMNRGLTVILALTMIPLFAPLSVSAGWYCRDEASIRRGSEILSCGVAESGNEAEARSEALRHAYEELSAVCGMSGDCAPFELNVVPLRTECVSIKDGYRCYRGIRGHITDRRIQSAASPFVQGRSRGVFGGAPRASAENRFQERQLDDFQRGVEITREIERRMLETFNR